jgi:peptidyl-prolyl cis-trans isomerase A (cyclophilin A)
MRCSVAGVAALTGLVLASCSTAPEPKKESAVPKPARTSEAPDVYKVRFVSSKGPFVIEVHREWAPLGADHFYELVKAGYYNEARFFRVVPKFVAQFGLAATPAMTKQWDKSIDDDPVGHTNSRGTVAFATAGRNSRTTQVFINLRSNQVLDDKGFAAFGQVVEGMEAVVDKLNSQCGEAPDQDAITRRGNSYLKSTFPRLDYIKTATLL